MLPRSASSLAADANLPVPPGPPGYLTKLLILLTDASFALTSLFFAIFLTADFSLESSAYLFSWTPLLLLALRLAAGLCFGTHLLILRYIGEKDYKNSFLATTASSAAFLALLAILPHSFPPARLLAIVLVDYLTFLLLSVGLRIALRLFYEQQRRWRLSGLNTVIFGAGELGALVEHTLRHRTAHHYRVTAFFDDNPKVHGKRLNGVRIYNPRQSFEEVVKRLDIKVAIIGIKRLPEERRVEFISTCLTHRIKVLKIPPAESWINGTLNVGQLQHIKLEDLLNRPPIRLNEYGIQQSIRGKVILVTGCAGLIGGELVRQLLQYQPKRIIGLDHSDSSMAEIHHALRQPIEAGTFHPVIGDIRDYDSLRQLFLQEGPPEYVFHAAAYKRGFIMERFPREAIRTNILGTRNIAELSKEFQVHKFVMISTTKVVNPGSVMGASMRIAETYVQSMHFLSNHQTQFITARVGNILGSPGGVVSIFKAQIEKGQPLTVTDPNIERAFFTTRETCQLALEAGSIGRGGEIFVFDPGKPIRILNLASKMIQMTGRTPGVDAQITFTGLRQGEKLTDELFGEQENASPTHHPQIKKAAVRPCNYFQISPQVEILLQEVASGQPGHVLVKRMKEIIPEFASQNSIFSALDAV